jgi:hypothetical protein
MRQREVLERLEVPDRDKLAVAVDELAIVVDKLTRLLERLIAEVARHR